MDDPRGDIGGRKGPLEGLLVVDFSTNLPGPMCTQKLAWMGATVVKIEPPGGDPTRQNYGGNMYRLTNAGKLVATLNLKNEAERAIARDLCTTADIVVEELQAGGGGTPGCWVRVREPREPEGRLLLAPGLRIIHNQGGPSIGTI